MINTTVLRPVAEPCGQLLSLADQIEKLISPHEDRKRARSGKADAAYQATLLSLLASIAMIALNIHSTGGVPTARGNSLYTGATVSAKALRAIIQGLEAEGLIKVSGWFHDPDKPSASRVTRIFPSAKFTALAQASGLTLGHLIAPPEQVIFLKEGKGACIAPLAVRASAITVHALNDLNREASLTLCPDGQAIVERDSISFSPEALYVWRSFKHTYDKGGRLYGGFWETLPKRVRSKLLIDGEPTTELDFKSQHPAILFAKAGRKLDFDPYKVAGFDHVSRGMGKRTFLRLLDKDPSRPHPLARLAPDMTEFPTTQDFRDFVTAMKAQLNPVRDFLGQDGALRLQKIDSDIALEVIATCVSEGINVYPVHDSFIVKSKHEGRIKEIMADASMCIIGIEIGIG